MGERQHVTHDGVLRGSMTVGGAFLFMLWTALVAPWFGWDGGFITLVLFATGGFEKIAAVALSGEWAKSGD